MIQFERMKRSTIRIFENERKTNDHLNATTGL